MRSVLSAVLAMLCASGLSGQEVRDDALRVTLMGTGAPPPGRARMGPSALVEAGDQKLLFDVGRGASSSIGSLGLNLGVIHTVFLTHLHVDHLSGLPDFWLTGHHRDRFGQRVEPVVVHGPPGVARMVDGLRRAYTEIARGWRLPDAALQIGAAEFDGPGIVYEQEGLRVTAFPVPHGDQTYGYKVEYGGRSVVISGDTGYSEEVIRQAEGADVLIHEVFYVDPNGGMAPDLRARLTVIHAEPEAAARVFAAARPKLAVATHLGQTPEETPALEAGVRAGYSGRFVVGQDLMSFVVGDSVRVIPCVAVRAVCGEAAVSRQEDRAALDRDAVEAVVRAFPLALAAYDWTALDTLTAPEARWVDSRGPISMEDVTEVLRTADSVGIDIGYAVPRDLQITVIDDAAWATYVIDATLTSASTGGLDFLRATMESSHPDQEEWKQSFAESVVLHRTDRGWRITLGHTTELP